MANNTTNPEGFEHNDRLNTSYFNRVPNEILIDMVSHSYGADRLNLALSQPSRFLSNTFHIFVQCASTQINLQASRSAPELNEPKEGIPLLYAAIIYHFDIKVIEDIVKVYQSLCPTSVNGIWGQVPKAVHPPLHCAVRASRPDVISLLLDYGADTRLKYCSTTTGFVGSGCVSSDVVHQQCVDRAGMPVPDDSACDTAMATVIELAWNYYFSPRTQDRAKTVRLLEECALELLRPGIPQPPYPTIRKMVRAASVGMSQLVIALVAGIAALGNNDPQRTNFVAAADGFIEQIALLAPEGSGDLIEYLARLGGPANYLLPIQDPWSGGLLQRRHRLLMSLDGLRPLNALGILKAHMVRGIALPPMDNLAYSATRSDENLPFLQAVYQMLDEGALDQHVGGLDRSAVKMLLLTNAIGRRSVETCRWLVGRGCPVTEAHVRDAVASDRATWDFQNFTISSIVRMGRPWFRLTLL